MNDKEIETLMREALAIRNVRSLIKWANIELDFLELDIKNMKEDMAHIREDIEIYKRSIQENK
jgi:hypothetical protein